MNFASAKRIVFSSLLVVCVSPTVAIVSTGREGHGLVGYGISMDKPTCAHACRDAITNPLDCGSSISGGSGTSVLTQGTDQPPPECYANNNAYLETLAYCIFTHCRDIETWRLEKFWERNVAGRHAQQPQPKESYQKTLERIEDPPVSITPPDKTLIGLSKVDDATYQALYNAEYSFTRSEVLHERYGLVLIFTAAFVPIICSLLRFAPIPTRLVTRFSAGFIYPSAWRSYHREPALGTVIVPTRGQALFIAYLLAINVILSAVGHHSKQPNGWYTTEKVEICTYVANRLGVLSFANIATSVLFAGRNNILLWITDWSHSTFLLLHRWVAVICVLQACLHSAIYLQIYTADAGYDYSSESEIPYWYWGIVATLTMALLVPMSVLPLRQKLYELFLAWHVILSLLALTGCYLHVYLRFDHQWGYEVWIYIAFAFWAFDRLMRVLRMAKNGVHEGHITKVDEDYIRLDVPGVFASGQVYLYFPSLTWRFWENHPFSVATGLLHQGSRIQEQQYQSAKLDSEQYTLDLEKAPAQHSQPALHEPSPAANRDYEIGLTFLIRARSGLTALLRHQKQLPVLVESSYGQSMLSKHGFGCIASYPNLICIVGGVGITAVLPLLAEHVGNKKLYWGVRGPNLVNAVSQISGGDSIANMDAEIVEGRRLDLQAILESELSLASNAGNGTAVVVSGPPSMADEARRIVSKLATKTNDAIGFFEETYGW